MGNMLLPIGLAFLEGLALILSPCILPILPFILSGSLDSGKRRPIGIICGFVMSFTAITLLSRQLVQYSGIDLNFLRDISFFLLALFGVVMLSAILTEKFARLTQRFANVGSSVKSLNSNEGGFYSGIIFGCLVGLIWTPCAGPILAAVIVQTVVQKSNVTSVLTVISFAIGAGVPMLLIALFGRAIVGNLSFLKQKALLIRKTLGVAILASVAYMIYGTYFMSLTLPSQEKSIRQTTLVNSITHPYLAPVLTGISAWINSAPLELDHLKGKVVLIDFWTYSCVNCLRTLPYLKDWYAKYHTQGFVIIGVHTPEFEFEKNLTNIQHAIVKDGIKYPIAVDNNFSTWQSFNNQYWPAHYLINQNGEVVYTHFGEGDYAATENNIRVLLGLNKTEVTAVKDTISRNYLLTPETYLGFARANSNASPEIVKKDLPAMYSFPMLLPANKWALQGKWIISATNITSAAKNAAIKIHFNASKVFIVMGSSTHKPIHATLLLNGKLIVREKGRDVKESTLSIDEHTLYEVIVQPKSKAGVLELTSLDPGLELYTFTFGE